jgi:hypothetical protein
MGEVAQPAFEVYRRLELHVRGFYLNPDLPPRVLCTDAVPVPSTFSAVSDAAPSGLRRRLATALVNVQGVVDGYNDASRPAVGIPISRMMAALLLAARLNDQDLELGDQGFLSLATLDAEQLQQMLAPLTTGGRLSDEDWTVAGFLADRLCESLIRLRSAPSFQQTDTQPVRRNQIVGLDSYSADAVRDDRWIRFMYISSFALILGGITVALLAVSRSFRHLDDYLGIAVAMLIVAAALAFNAGRARMAAREARRVHRDLVRFDQYVASLSRPVQELLRGVMVQRLFPRLLEDDDPIREPRWPDANTLLTAILHE